ncbi:MAG: hypothetical protein HC787_09385 [Nostocaceae cyanobacterium CSU_2_110]|nr:hypothetical protein [Candidatus Methylacidiphilales bacterium]NJS16982.1 hypothetical protein [Nostocaceae cyanobacterium CSU_2_110]
MLQSLFELVSVYCDRYIIHLFNFSEKNTRSEFNHETSFMRIRRYVLADLVFLT